MFSQLGPLFKTTLRQAEKSDTRLEIRREEKENPGRKDEEDSGAEETSALWEDSTAVSVEALRTFLIEFLKTRGDHPSQNSMPDQEAGYTPTPEYRPPANNTAARAVKAYASTAGQVSAPPPPAEEEPEQTVDLADLLKADELRTIHVLIHELDMLSRSGVQTLVIEKADTFLEALVQAVRLQKGAV